MDSPMTISVERKSPRRYPAVPNAAVVAFKSRGKTRIAAAMLVNISSTGALLSMLAKPRLNEPIAIRLDYPVPTSPMPAVVVRIGDAGDVGVAFVRACNRAFFWTATRGEDLHTAPPERPTPEATRPGD